MVNVFIVHSGSNYKEAQSLRKQLEGTHDANNKELDPHESSHSNVLILENGGPFWKIEAKKLIKQAQLVIFLQGEHSAESPYIRWEIETALKHNKEIILHPLDTTLASPQWLTKPDAFSKLPKLKARIIDNVEGIKERIRSYDLGKYNVFTDDIEKILADPARKAELFEQYKLYQETSENLVSRRQSISNFYISANSAITGFLGVLLTMSASLSNTLCIIIAFSFVGTILNISWVNILDSYGTLNASKMKVIRLIEQQLPISLYDSEWIIMSDKLNSKKYQSFTASEKRIPIIFSFVYIISIIVSIVVLTITNM